MGVRYWDAYTYRCGVEFRTAVLSPEGKKSLTCSKTANAPATKRS
nr:MAG TPA: hypothetical protein [Caudoviricetes sp.]